ncbi:hypothetical protein OGAPHI_004043 [Ogataea philodendri]|uniref:BZIP domain-containing protein n=1 Tax=Ogataea philodendri TaxID=1378263 RepID=A0A9P8T589_9ASCO|nr:uncharacterized protein OGAPHI_004043 [Ogataea philodendri]KAH3665855.1 hypothetical protein OGAPHI_004043 [Ogataea philodendri]
MDVRSDSPKFWKQYSYPDNSEVSVSLSGLGSNGGSGSATFSSPQVLDKHILQQQQFQNNVAQHSYDMPITENMHEECEKAEKELRKDVGEGIWEQVFVQDKDTAKRPISSAGTNETSGSPQNAADEATMAEKRKAQNRAAQRAFRERKEVKLKELSAKLTQSEAEKQRLLNEIEQLRQRNALLGIENELLHKSENANIVEAPKLGSGAHKFDFPRTREEFIKSIIDPQQHQTSHTETPTPIQAPHSMVDGVSYAIEKYHHNDQDLLTVAAVWDYLNELATKNDEVDFNIPAIIEQLRGKEVCHGHGPAYPISLVNLIVQKTLNA